MATDRINEAETYLGQKAWSSASSGRTLVRLQCAIQLKKMNLFGDNPEER